MKLHFSLFILSRATQERKPDIRQPDERLTAQEREINQRKPPRERRKYLERAETYESQSHCSRRNELTQVQNGDAKVCCDWRTGENHHECVGCNPEMGIPCEEQGVFDYEYVYYDYDGVVCTPPDDGCYYYYYTWKETRDCYCDRKCEDMGDCCDDILETCPSYFRPGEVKEVQFSTGNIKYFYGGSGLNNEDAFKRHVQDIEFFWPHIFSMSAS